MPSTKKKIDSGIFKNVTSPSLILFFQCIEFLLLKSGQLSVLEPYRAQSLFETQSLSKTDVKFQKHKLQTTMVWFGSCVWKIKAVKWGVKPFGRFDIFYFLKATHSPKGTENYSCNRSNTITASLLQPITDEK